MDGSTAPVVGFVLATPAPTTTAEGLVEVRIIENGALPEARCGVEERFFGGERLTVFIVCPHASLLQESPGLAAPLLGLDLGGNALRGNDSGPGLKRRGSLRGDAVEEAALPIPTGNGGGGSSSEEEIDLTRPAKSVRFADASPGAPLARSYPEQRESGPLFVTLKVATSDLLKSTPPGRIVQIAAQVLRRGEQPEGSATADVAQPFAVLVDPGAAIAPTATRTHGIDYDVIGSSGATDLVTALCSFGGWLADARRKEAPYATELPSVVLVTQSSFDVEALVADGERVVGGQGRVMGFLRSNGIKAVIDASDLFHDAFRGPRCEGFGYSHRPPANYKLATLAASFGVGPQARPHSAPEDAALLHDLLVAAAVEDGGYDAFLRRMKRRTRRF